MRKTLTFTLNMPVVITATFEIPDDYEEGELGTEAEIRQVIRSTCDASVAEVSEALGHDADGALVIEEAWRLAADAEG